VRLIATWDGSGRHPVRASATVATHSTSDTPASKLNTRRFTEEIVQPRQYSSANHYPVTTHVNRPANDGPECVEPL
jgi:putative SOS response-associated peptidase YedK